VNQGVLDLPRRVLLIPAALLVAYLLTGVTSVRPGERAVVRRFGAVVATPGPGLWVGLPWGFERVDRVPVDLVRRVELGYDPDAEVDVPLPEGHLLTGDQNVVAVKIVIDYAVRPDEVATYLAARDRVDGAVSRLAETALAEWIASRPVDEVLLTGKAVLPGELTARLNERLEPLHLGIDVQAVGVAYLAPPDEAEVRDAFAAVTRAQANIQTQEQEAATKAESLMRTARARAFESEQSAAAQSHERIAMANADADAFRLRLAQYRHMRQTNPNALAAIWWNELGPVFAKLHAAGRLEVLDNFLGPDGLDIMQIGPRMQKK
jgi:membrane protease subunit HflK